MTPPPRGPLVILMADDDEDDRLLAHEALAESRLAGVLHFVGDGVELMEFLERRGRHAEAPRPEIILLDLNMPRMDGREALRAIKGDAALRSIPVLILSTSRADEDVARSYDLGASSFIPKPVTFAGLVEVMRTLGAYWRDVVELPRREDE